MAFTPSRLVIEAGLMLIALETLCVDVAAGGVETVTAEVGLPSMAREVREKRKPITTSNKTASAKVIHVRFIYRNDTTGMQKQKEPIRPLLFFMISPYFID